MTDIPFTTTCWAHLSNLKAGTGTLTCLAPSNPEQLQNALSHPHPDPVIIGNGTNLIGTDSNGLTALKLPPAFTLPDSEQTVQQLDSTTILASAGLPLTRLLLRLAEMGLGGYHKLSGIPGTLGGALAMNAGALGQQIQNTVQSLHGLHLGDGSQWSWSRQTQSPHDWAYRTSPVPPDVILTHALLRLEPISPEAELQTIRQELTRRAKVTPKGSSIGSIFRNPTGDYAGRLLQEAGCCGLSQGPFSVSMQHANWIVNLERTAGSAQDAIALMERMQTAVYNSFGIRLRPECRVISHANQACPPIV